MLRDSVPINKLPFLTCSRILEALPRFASLPEGRNENIKYFTLQNGNQTHNRCVYSYTFVPLDHKIDTSNLTSTWLLEASRGAAARSVTIKSTGCGFGPHSRRWNIYLNLYFHFFALMSRLSAALSSATQHALPPEVGRKRGTECLNTRPTLLCAGYSVKLIKNKNKWLFYENIELY